MTLTIYPVGESTDGVDLTTYIAYKGIKWQRADVDGEDAGRTLDGLLHRDRRAIKIRLDVTCRPLTATESATVLAAIEPEWVDVVYDDPRLGENTRKTVYSNNIPASYEFEKDGVDYWGGIAFPLIEK
jgi:hypothetical protein